MIDRRKFITGTAALAGGSALLSRLRAQDTVQTQASRAAANKDKPLMERIDPKPTHPPGEAGTDYRRAFDL